MLEPDDMAQSAALAAADTALLADADEPDVADESSNSFKHSVHEQEHRIILATMKACANRRKDVAQKLGISDRTLRYKLARMRDCGIDLPV